jgi:general secretion pathway protein A
MYYDFYHLKRPPFLTRPELTSLFISPYQYAAVECISHGIADRQGVCVLIGADGVGKTTLLRACLESHRQRRLKTIYLADANVPFIDVLGTIYRALGLQVTTGLLSELLTDLYKFLINEYKNSINIALIVDNAEYYSIVNLEYLMLLNKINIHSRHIIQVVLVGNMAFKKSVDENFSKSLKQDISILSYLSPLNKEESYRYIYYHLAKIRVRDEPIFTNKALQYLIDYAQGIPRSLNTVCTEAMMEGFWCQQKLITAKIVRRAIAQIEQHKRRT